MPKRRAPRPAPPAPRRPYDDARPASVEAARRRKLEDAHRQQLAALREQRDALKRELRIANDTIAALTQRLEEANLREPPADTAAQRIANIAMTSADLFPGVKPDRQGTNSDTTFRTLFLRALAKRSADKP